LTYYEVANAVRHKAARELGKRNHQEVFQQAFELIELYAIHSFSEVTHDALALALELKITVYDAAFIALAKTLGVKLLTLDVKLAKALEGTNYEAFVEYPE
jgi:predicted nucleic acid-binding protein